MASIKILGAAQEVTGSCHLLESSVTGKVLLDCGMHQGGDNTSRLNKEQFNFDPTEIQSVILSHAHIDHSGLLPKLVHSGFDGKIFCTYGTMDLLDIMLKDTVHLYLKDLERENRHRERKNKKTLAPLYTQEDVEKVLKQCVPQRFEKSFQIAEGASVTFYDAGHILGSASVEIKLKEQGKEKILVFSGDIGKKDSPLMHDPKTLQKADLVLMEGTYGDRNHKTKEETIQEFKTVLHEAWERGGNVLIPAFAVGRTQELLFYLGLLQSQGELDNWEVAIDSPMAINVSKVYDRWLHQLDCEGVKSLCDGDKTLLGRFVEKLRLCPSAEESMALNEINKGLIVIAGSGMCTGGRIRHHFKQRIWNEKNTVVFVGFQAQGTLGRILVEGVKKIKLYGEEYAVNAHIETLGGFSAHAGQTELIDWISHFDNNPQVALVHGEATALDVLAEKLWKEKKIRVQIPFPKQSFAF